MIGRPLAALRPALLCAIAAASCVLFAAVATSAASAALEDRAYELVTPGPDGLGGVIFGTSAGDGDTVRWAALAAYPDGRSSQLVVSNVARRGAAGWASTNADAPLIDPILGELNRSMPLAQSDDFSHVLFASWAQLHPDDVDFFSPDWYRIDVETGELDFVSDGDDNATGGSNSSYGGGSRDLSHVVFDMNGVALIDGAHTYSVYEWADGELRLVSILPDGTPATSTSNVAANASARGGLSPGDNGGAPAHGGPHTVSDDGSRIFWRNGGRIYMRKDGTETVLLSASHVTGSEGTPATNANFISANRDGTVVYFRSTQQLTDEATVGGGIYRLDVDADELELITPDAKQTNSQVTDAVLSDDGSRLYFVASSAMTPGAVAGQRNVYVWDGDETRLITTLTGSAVGSNSTRIERVSRDGSYALIGGTGDVAGAQLNGNYGYYRYDFDADALECASCRADGSPSQARARVNVGAPALPSPEFMIAPRGMTDDGRVYFTSFDSLVEDDINSVADAYEFGDDGLRLISGGRGDVNSYYADNSDDGSTVFFTTTDGLVTADGDGGAYDLYAARVGGGFPEPPAPPAPCRGDDCQGAPSSSDLAWAPVASEGLIGAGNVRASRWRIGGVGAAKLRRFARTGVLRLPVRVGGPGKVRARAVARVGGRVRRVGGARAVVRGSGPRTVRLAVRLSRPARRALRSRGRLRIAIRVRFSGAGGPRRMTMTLKRAQR